MNQPTKICPACGVNKPFTEYHIDKTRSDGVHKKCKECRKIDTKLYNEANREVRNQKDREYHHKNRETRNAGRKARLERIPPEIRKANRRAHYLENQELMREKKRQYRAENPDKVRESNNRIRAKRRALPREPYTIQDVLDRWGTNCHICGEPIDLTAPRHTQYPGWERGLQKDHVIPMSKGGPDVLENVKPAHGLCNSAKYNL
jgi:HNH endonuclease